MFFRIDSILSFMSKSIKTNFIYNLLNTVVGLLFPIVTFPYVTRVVMAEGIGKVNFLYSIINYIALFTAIGIPLYAVREIAKVRDDQKQLNQTTAEILILHLLLTIGGYIVVFLVALFVNRVNEDFWLFILLSSHLLLTAIGVSWFYQAVEDYRYITIRSLLIRIVALICLFAFVRDKSDLYAYAAITIISEVGNYLINFFHLRHYVRPSLINWQNLDLRRHIRPSLKIFLLNIITSIYAHLDSVMLGFLDSDVAVGFYFAANRITKALLGVIGSLGAVLLPRLSNLVANGAIEGFKSVGQKATSIIVTITIPSACGLIFLAPEIINLFCFSC